MNRYIGILIGMLALLSACGTDSLEDTYKEYAGEGEIRYLGKCTDLSVTPGWQRIIVTWKNNIDPAIQQVKVAWLLDDTRDSVLLERGTTEYSIDKLNGQPLEDGNYEISVSGVDCNGNTSIANMTFGRPYTHSHEEIRAFNRVISRVYFIQDRAVLFFSEWQDNMEKAVLSYPKTDGTTGELELTKEFLEQARVQNGGLYWMLEDPVNISKEEGCNLVLLRRAKLPDCKDEIEFEPYVFDADKTYDSDFVQEMKVQFGYAEIPAGWADTVRTIYLDWSVGSFNSLLNLPKLEKLVLGGRRYQLESSMNDVQYGQSKVSDQGAANFVLSVLNELNGLTVERYNKHFQELEKTDYVSNCGMPLVPKVDFIDMTGLQFMEYPESKVNSGLANLTDGNPATYWNPEGQPAFTSYELTLDLKSPKTINGICFVQKQYSGDEIVIAPEYVKVKVSNNGLYWEDATYVEDVPVGKSSGETTYIPFIKDVRTATYQYVKVQVNTVIYGSYYCSSIAEIRLY
ncbi:MULTISPECIES: DUF4998 domain-containing protein [Butyricimonas]|uniref:DUF4998 domain-containing protein n=1 Tax=Butyricimonas TaxID=574697 RepID=UPI001D090EB4|nr:MULTISPECIES: DUF4998 domain-containing protein [Butyricimonas]MCB6974795.1 discoidin domain-containing protein [Butyricimonas synergistica]MCG4521537.1 discoidin domain-containing protein [Butyricimonas sp. DFI.6.44]